MIPLTVEQERELRRYADGLPRRPASRPNSNLIRRNLLTSSPPRAGASERSGWYRITPLGEAALAERSS